MGGGLLLAAAVPCLAVVHERVGAVVDEAGGPCISSQRRDRRTCPRATGWSAHVRTQRPRPLRLETGRDTSEHMPRRQAVVARASGASLPFTLPAPIMHVSTVPRASAHACMCQCLSRLAPGIAKPSALHSDIPSSNDVAS